MKLLSGTYLKSEDANNGDSLTFRDEGTWITSQKFTYEDGTFRKDFVIKVSHKGVEKNMRLNKTNRDAMILAYGDDTADWVGQSALIVKEKVMVAGKKMDCIMLEAPAVNNPLTKKDKDDLAADADQIPF